jgi:hypothetical protein
MSEEVKTRKKRKKKKGPSSNINKKNVKFPKHFSLEKLIDSHKPKIGRPKKNPLETIQTLWGGRKWKKRLTETGWRHSTIGNLNIFSRDLAFEEADLVLLKAPDTKRIKIKTAGMLEADYYSTHFIESNKPVVFKTTLTLEQVEKICDVMKKKKYSSIHIRHEFFKDPVLEINEIAVDLSMNIEEVGFEYINDTFPHYVIDALRKEEIELQVQLEEKRKQILQAQGIIDPNEEKWDRQKRIDELAKKEEKERKKEEKRKAKEEEAEKERKEKLHQKDLARRRYRYSRNKGIYNKGGKVTNKKRKKVKRKTSDTEETTTE